MKNTMNYFNRTTESEPSVQPEKEKVRMPDKAKELLKSLYLYRSYSGFEEPIRAGITHFLDSLQIPYVNFNGNIIGFNHPGAPLFSAHMDMVNTEGYKLGPKEVALDDNHVFTMDSKACIRLYRDQEKKVQTSLGADDKNGIWVILMLLKSKEKINFAFCHSEECGGTGSRQIAGDRELSTFISDCKYCVVIDRRNKGDIIGYKNKYCLALDDRLSAFAKDKGFDFSPVTGSISDADRFSEFVECVNISCGYYEPHTSREYTNVNELWDTYLLCKEMLKSFDYHSVSAGRMKDFKGVTYSSTYKSTKKNEDDDEIVSYYNSYNRDNYTGFCSKKKKSENDAIDNTRFGF